MSRPSRCQLIRAPHLISIAHSCPRSRLSRLLRQQCSVTMSLPPIALDTHYSLPKDAQQLPCAFLDHSSTHCGCRPASAAAAAPGREPQAARVWHCASSARPPIEWRVAAGPPAQDKLRPPGGSCGVARRTASPAAARRQIPAARPLPSPTLPWFWKPLCRRRARPPCAAAWTRRCAPGGAASGRAAGRPKPPPPALRRWSCPLRGQQEQLQETAWDIRSSCIMWECSPQATH